MTAVLLIASEDFNIGMQSNMYEPIWYKFDLMIKMVELQVMILNQLPLTLIRSHRRPRKQNNNNNSNNNNKTNKNQPTKQQQNPKQTKPNKTKNKQQQKNKQTNKNLLSYLTVFKRFGRNFGILLRRGSVIWPHTHSISFLQFSRERTLSL